MTEMDKALEVFRQDTDNPKNQSHFYDLFLNSTFYIPTASEEILDEAAKAAEQGYAMPLIIEADGKDYLMLFDSEERLNNWAQADVRFVTVPGYAIAATTPSSLHWAMNVGTDSSKEFVPDEIAWLKGVVEQCKARAEQEE